MIIERKDIKVLTVSGKNEKIKNKEDSYEGKNLNYFCENFNTGIKAFNMILNERYIICKKLGINLNVIGRYDKPLKLDLYTGNIIFGSMMDVEINMCLGINTTERGKYIHIVVSPTLNPGGVLIHTENPYDPMKERELSSKYINNRNALIKNIKEEVGKYKGHVMQCRTHDMYKLKIYLQSNSE